MNQPINLPEVIAEVEARNSLMLEHAMLLHGLIDSDLNPDLRMKIARVSADYPQWIAVGRVLKNLLVEYQSTLAEARERFEEISEELNALNSQSV